MTHAQNHILSRTAVTLRLCMVGLAVFVFLIWNDSIAASDLQTSTRQKKETVSAPTARPSAPTKEVSKVAAVSKQAARKRSKLATTPKASAPAKESTPRYYESRGRRDPFRSLVVRATELTPSSLPAGKKGLVVAEITLRGIVKSQDHYLAVVDTMKNPKAIFLREGDEVFNGKVLKISKDSIVFEEQLIDSFGKPFTREAVKKILASTGVSQ